MFTGIREMVVVEVENLYGRSADRVQTAHVNPKGAAAYPAAAF